MPRLKLTPAVALLAVPLLLVGYVLSVGPFFCMVDFGPADANVQPNFGCKCYLAVYAPLFWLSGHVPAFDDWLTRYCYWCAGS